MLVWCVLLLINNAAFSVGCVCIWTVCVLRAKQQEMCLLLWLIKCQCFRFSSGGHRMWKAFTVYVLLLTLCPLSCWMHHPTRPDGDMPAEFTHFTRTQLTTKTFVREHPGAEIYISDILLVKPLIYSPLPLWWIPKQEFSHLLLPHTINTSFPRK